MNCAYGGGMIERFANFPRPPVLPGGDLQVSTSEIDANGQTKDIIGCYLQTYICPSPANSKYKFDLMLEIACAGRVRYRLAIQYYCVRRLLKEEGRFSLIPTHFSDVRRIISAYAVNAANTIEKLSASNRQPRNGIRRGVWDLVTHCRAVPGKCRAFPVRLGQNTKREWCQNAPLK